MSAPEKPPVVRTCDCYKIINGGTHYDGCASVSAEEKPMDTPMTPREMAGEIVRAWIERNHQDLPATWKRIDTLIAQRDAVLLEPLQAELAEEKAAYVTKVREWHDERARLASLEQENEAVSSQCASAERELNEVFKENERLRRQIAAMELIREGDIEQISALLSLLGKEEKNEAG